jgi:polar amino acid transport system substrate-binding protein
VRKYAIPAACALFLAVGTGHLYAEDGVQEKVYIIATDTVFAPFEFQDKDGNHAGIDIELLAAIATDQGFRYELKALGFKAAIAALESGQADGIIAGMTITDERRLKYDFSQPYYDSGVVMAIKADNYDVNSYYDLEGRLVAVKTGTEGAAFAESIKDFYGFTLLYFDESLSMYGEIRSGNSAACFEDYPVMGYGIMKGNGLKMVTVMETESSYGFAVLKGKNADLLRRFDQGLRNLQDSGKYRQILDKYAFNSR